jgi:hypothetical protein
MAATIVEFITYAGQTLTAYLAARTGATGTPAVDYACTEIDTGQYRFTVDEALVGEFDLEVKDATDELALRQFVGLLDDTEIHRAYDYTVADVQGGDASLANQEDMIATLAAIQSQANLLTAGAVMVLPCRVAGSTLTVFLGETHQIVLETNDWTSKTVRLVFETEDSVTDIASIDDAGLTKTASTTAFTMPLAVTNAIRRLRYSFRDEGNGDEVLAWGKIKVRPAPLLD